MSMSNSQEVLTSTSGAKKRSRVRIVILLLLSVGTMINYLDRTIPGYCSATVKQRNPYRSGDDGHHLLRLRLGLMRWRRSPAGCF